MLSVGVTLSGPLSVIGLVGHYPTNYLILRELIKERLAALRRALRASYKVKKVES